jgi:hypothetical protein
MFVGAALKGAGAARGEALRDNFTVRMHAQEH